MTIVNSSFQVGDMVRLKATSWLNSQAELKRFGFTEPQIDKAYEVTYVCESNNSISLRGNSSLYFASYFELAKKDFTPVTQEQAEHIGGSVSALDKQVSGNHYKDCKIQPIEYIQANGLSYLEGNVIKYTTRHSKKNGKADIEKAIHYLELILEMEYKES